MNGFASEKELRMRGIEKKIWGMMAGVAVATLFCAQMTFAAGAVITNCTFCHGMPPNDGPRVGSTAYNASSQFVGKHATHTSSATASCAKCHRSIAVLASYDTGHMDGFINMTGKINASPAAGANYRGLKFFNQTSVPALGTCASINCHFEKITPTWGSASLSGVSAGTCGACHNSQSGSGDATGAHLKHYQTLGNSLATACQKCHVDYATSGTPFAHATSAGKRGLIVALPTGTYGGTVTYPAYLPSNAPLRNGTCSSVYCHSTAQGANGSGTPTYAAPTWSSGALNCASCHVDMSTNAVGTGSHRKHTNTGTYNMACSVCHGTGYSAGAVTSTNHVNTTIEVAMNPGTYNGGTAVGNGYSTCTNTYCHSNGTATGTATPANTSIAWGTTATCNSCHTNATLTFAHSSHIGSYTCDKCHYLTAANNTSIRFPSGAATHVNESRDVVIALYTSATPILRTTVWQNGTQCVNVYCHGDGQGLLGNSTANPINWSGTANTCTTCHPISGIVSGAHDKHVAAPADCQNCHHATTVSGIAAIPQYHANQKVTIQYGGTVFTAVNTGGNYNGQPAGGASVGEKFIGSAVQSTCANIYCHSTAQNPTSGAATPTYATTPNWGTTGTLGCSGCHADMRTAGGIQASGLGSHYKHVNAGTYNFICDTCHAGYTATTANSATHVNNAINVTISATYGGAFNGGTAVGNGYSTCSNTYCHSDGTNTVTPAANTSVAWGFSNLFVCSPCHGFPPAYASGSPKANSHVQHVTTGGYTCDYCHVLTTSTNSSISSYARHNNRFYNVSGSKTRLAVSNFTYNSAGKTCSTSQCHSSVMTWGSNTTAHTCTKCHGTLTTAASVTNAQMAPATGGHQAHVRGTGTFNYSRILTCWECHNSGTAANFGGHMNGSANVTFANASTAGDNATTTNWNSAAKTCTVYCHGAKMLHGDTSGTLRTPVWTNTPMTGVATNDCILCHGNPPTTGTSASTHSGQAATTSCNGCHDHFTTTGGFASETARRLHINGAIEGGSCIGCHANAITRAVGPAAGKQLANISIEFGTAYGHKKSGRGAVTDADCIVCHLEGDFSTGKVVPAGGTHKNGYIDLRNPDGVGEVAITNISGGAFTFARFSTSYAAGSRTSSGNTANTIDNVITQKFCLACHDSDGATNTTARAGSSPTATAPFGGGNSVLDAKTQFATTNSSKHPVMGARSADFPTTIRLADPYKPTGTRGTQGTKTAGVVINCFDCHNTGTTSGMKTLRTVSAHGDANVLIRGGGASTNGTIYVSSPTHCSSCHITYNNSYPGHNTGTSGSAFGTSDGDMNSATFNNCHYCHADTNSTTGTTVAQRSSNIHGVNALPASGATKTGRWSGTSTGSPAQVETRPYAFIRNTLNLSNSQPRVIGSSTYTSQCSMTSGGACSNQSNKSYTPGGTY